MKPSELLVARPGFAILAGLLLCLLGPAHADNAASYNNGTLTLPSVNTETQVGQYQEGELRMDANGQWQLTNVRVLGGYPSLYQAPVDQVTVVKTSGLPVQVLLRASGSFSSGCGSLGRISQRRVGNRFEVLLADGFTAYAVASCTAVMQPYVKTIPLETYGLAAGTYTYDVNGVTGSFELSASNELAGDCFGTGCQNP